MHAELISEASWPPRSPLPAPPLPLHRRSAPTPSFWWPPPAARPPATAGARPGPVPMAGFMAGALDLGALYRRFLLRDGVPAAADLTPPPAAGHPALRPGRRCATGPARPEPETSGAELLSIAVDPGLAGPPRRARSWSTRFLTELASRGVHRRPGRGGSGQRSRLALYDESRLPAGPDLRAPPGHRPRSSCADGPDERPWSGRRSRWPAAVALVATPLAVAVARAHRGGRPSGRPQGQSRPVPYLGGAAVFLAAVIGRRARPSSAPPPSRPRPRPRGGRRRRPSPPLGPPGRPAGHRGLVAAVVPTHLPGALGPILVVAVTVLLINGVNMIDGLDALAGGLVAVAAAGLRLVAPGRRPRPGPGPRPAAWPASSSTTAPRPASTWATAAPTSWAPPSPSSWPRPGPRGSAPPPAWPAW